MKCPDCGRDFSPSCRRATGQAWDPTVGVRSTDADRHLYSRRGYGPSESERAALRRRAGGAR